MENVVGCAFYFKSTNCKWKAKIDKNVSIFVAEALAILYALRHLYNEAHLESGRYRILSDSLSVIKTLQNLEYTAKAHPAIIKIREMIIFLQEEDFDGIPRT